MQTRPARLSDIPAILELWVELIEYHSEFDDLFTLADDAVSSFQVHLESQIEAADSLVLVSVVNSVLVGLVMANVGNYPPVFVRKTCGIIENLAVTASHRRTGCGERLLEAALAWLRKGGVDRVELRVASQNDVGYAFWKKHGFTDYIHVLRRDI